MAKWAKVSPAMIALQTLDVCRGHALRSGSRCWRGIYRGYVADIVGP